MTVFLAIPLPKIPYTYTRYMYGSGPELLINTTCMAQLASVCVVCVCKGATSYTNVHHIAHSWGPSGSCVF
jgi:hypothetical protein